nr:MAG TPA: RNase adapter protein [Caudoviricetes sp.]
MTKRRALLCTGGQHHLFSQCTLVSYHKVAEM